MDNLLNIDMNWLPILWVILGLLFLALAIFHFFQANKKIRSFQLTKRPGTGQGRVQILGSDVDQPLKDFVTDFNTYISEINNSNRLMNIIAAIGYVLASLTAFFSSYLSSLPR